MAEAPLEPETPPAAPPGPPELTPEPIEEEAEESDGADWDALDLDEITLPGQKSAKELAAEKVSRRALHIGLIYAPDCFVNVTHFV